MSYTTTSINSSNSPLVVDAYLISALIGKNPKMDKQEAIMHLLFNNNLLDVFFPRKISGSKSNEQMNKSPSYTRLNVVKSISQHAQHYLNKNKITKYESNKSLQLFVIHKKKNKIRCIRYNTKNTPVYYIIKGMAELQHDETIINTNELCDNVQLLTMMCCGKCTKGINYLNSNGPDGDEWGDFSDEYAKEIIEYSTTKMDSIITELTYTVNFVKQLIDDPKCEAAAEFKHIAGRYIFKMSRGIFT